jgi:hypothetical protein
MISNTSPPEEKLPPGAGHHDGLDRIVHRAGAEKIRQFPVALEGQRVLSLGPVQRHRRYAIGHRQQEVFGRIQRQWQRDRIGRRAHGIFLNLFVIARSESDEAIHSALAAWIASLRSQ